MLIEYIKKDSVEILANITIPSFDNDNEKEIPQIILETKGAIIIELHYVTKQSKAQTNPTDTCFIATYLEKDWEGIDPTSLEGACSYNYNDGNCVFGISSTGNYIIRFRVGTKKKSYKLIVK